ncbi:hypothetical protein EBZ38_17090 [bacterium]|nr:hypothetical protein [bacterium]
MVCIKVYTKGYTRYTLHTLHITHGTHEGYTRYTLHTLHTKVTHARLYTHVFALYNAFKFERCIATDVWKLV